MHEMTVAAELVRILSDAAAGAEAKQVVSARLRIGALSCLSHDALSFGFEALSRDTPAEGCQLEIVTVPAAGTCAACGWTGEVTDTLSLFCPECEEGPLRLEGGQEMTVESATVE